MDHGIASNASSVNWTWLHNSSNRPKKFGYGSAVARGYFVSSSVLRCSFQERGWPESSSDKRRVMLAVPAAARLPFSTFCFPYLARRHRGMAPLCSRSPSPHRALASSSSDSPPAHHPLKPWLIVGLGNPGKMYERTRHNVGFEMLDAIAEAEGIEVSSMHFRAMIGKGSIGNNPIMLAKPQTFMNLSGEPVGSLVSYFKIPLNQVLLIYDDLDLPFAKLRLLPQGGHGGHNGMRSVISHLKGSREFPRLRIGIGRPPGKMDAANFVLRPFNKSEREEINFTFQKGVEAIRILVLQGVNKSATFVNSKPPSELLNR